jgi:hypothetical protein
MEIGKAHWIYNFATGKVILFQIFEIHTYPLPV